MIAHANLGRIDGMEDGRLDALIRGLPYADFDAAVWPVIQSAFGYMGQKCSAASRLIVLAETRVRDSAQREQLRAEINTLASDLIGAPPDQVVLAPPGTVLKTSSGKLRREWRKVKVDGHVEDVLAAARELNRQ